MTYNSSTTVTISGLGHLAGESSLGVLANGVSVDGLSLSTTITNIASPIHADFTSTNAFLYVPGVDLQKFVGTDTGTTYAKVTLTDIGGGKAIGYIAGTGTGETLAAEDITDWTNVGGAIGYEKFNSVGKNIATAINTASAGWALTNAFVTSIPALGNLYKTVCTLTLNSGIAPFHLLVSAGRAYGEKLLGVGSNTIYTPQRFDAADVKSAVHNDAGDATSFSLVISTKHVTEPNVASVGGVHIVSARNGIVRDWTSITTVIPGAEFNHDAIVSGTIEYAPFSIILPSPASKVHVGLPMTTDIKTLRCGPIEAQGKIKRISRLITRVFETAGSLLVGSSASDTDTRNFGTSITTDDIIFTMPTGYDTEGQIFIRKSDPLPMTVLSVIPELEVFDGIDGI